VGGEQGEVQFWYVRNSRGLREDWKHERPGREFSFENDLDLNVIPRDRRAGQTKDDLLRARMYSFRQGVLLPAAPVFDAFTGIMGAIYERSVEGFSPLATLDDLGHFARQRMEFLKRLCSPTTASTLSRCCRLWVALCTSTASAAMVRYASTSRAKDRSGLF
jgi:hypothetical protein